MATFEYDVRGRRTALIDAVGNRSTFAYDGAGRTTSRTSPGNHTSTWTFDPAGRMLTAADPLGNTAHYTWDAADQLTRITLPRGGRYDYTYDGAGRMATETDPLGEVTSYGYDGEGRPTSTAYPSGRTVSAGYDAAGRRTTLTAGGQTRTFGYDDAGRISSASGPSAGTLTFGYDNRGLMTRSTDGFGDTLYGYDAALRLTSRTPPTGTATTYSYESNRGLLASVRGPVNADFTSYDNAGRVRSRQAVSPSTSGAETRTYDATGQLASINGPVYDATLTYHPDGQIATVTGGGATPEVTTYGYDAGGHLTSSTLTQGPSTLSTETYTWDADGNRSGVSRGGQPPVTASHDPANRLMSTSDGVSYTYSDDGLQLTAGSTGYAYNGFGELTSAGTPAGTISYGRDALGRLASRTTAGLTESFGYDGGSIDLAQSQTGAGPRTALVRSPGGLLLAQATAGSVARQAWANEHGDLVALKDDTGATVRWQADYDSFGSVTSSTGSAAVPLGFQSMYTDAATGLVNMGTRQYDPRSGSFTARDSVAGALSSPVTLNRYLYAQADPVDFFDPDGRWPSFVDNAVNAVVDAAESAADWAVDTVSDAVNTVSDFIGGVANTVGNWIGNTVGAVSDWVGNATNAVSNAAANAQRAIANKAAAAKKAAAREWQRTKTLAAQAAAEVKEFWKEHGDQIMAFAASAVVGAAVFGLCTVATAGAGSIGCMALAGAAGGAVYGGMTCPQGTSTAKCVGVGALAGGVAGLTFGAVSAAGGGLLLAGAAAGLTGDLTDQLVTTGTVDPVRLATATVLGGAMAFAGGKVPGVRGKPAGTRDPPVRQAAGCRHSFDPATPVLMADGSPRRIDEVQIGDKVLATDPVTGETSAKPVTALHVNTDTDLTDVTVRDGDTEHTIRTTAHHPFWDATDSQWVDAGDLTPGHRLLVHDDQRPGGATAEVTVVKVDQRPGAAVMRDLTVADFHTYHVLAGDRPVLVHNCNTIDPATVRFSQKGVSENFKDGRSVLDLADELMNGKDPLGVEPIRLVERSGNLFTLDNRRLVAFQIADTPVPFRMATAREARRERWKFDTQVDGLGIMVRGLGWWGGGP